MLPHLLLTGNFRLVTVSQSTRGIRHAMGLFEIIAKDKTSHDEFDLGRILADAGVDLSDDDACLDALVAAGVRPWQFKGDWMRAKIEAHNLLAARARVRDALKEALAVVFLISVFLLGSALLSPGLASARAAEQSPLAHHLFRGLLVIGFVCTVGAVVSLMITRKEDR